MYIRLDLNNFDFRLIFKHDIPASKHKIVRAYHVELLQRLSESGIDVWPPETAAPRIYNHDIFNLYIKRLFLALDLGLDPDDINPVSLHHFCICTEPTEERFGLSWLEQLMGFSIAPAAPPDPNAPQFPTTGDDVLDVKVDLFLIFKRHAPKLWESHSLEELALMSRQANERMRDPSEETDKDWQDFQPEQQEELPLFVTNKDLILTKLQERNIPVPYDF